MKAPKIKVSPDTLGTLMADFEKGEIRIPRFQRDFVWERSRILKLLDSMYNEFPIGTIFLWSAPPEYNYLLRNLNELGLPELQTHQGYRFILDGQQRLTSLFVVIKGADFEGEDYRKIVVDLEAGADEDGQFRYRNPDHKRWISVSELLAYDTFAVYNSLPSDDHKKRFTEVRSALSAYPFSVVTVADMEINDAIEIFERINQQGRKLSRYDLICASVMTADFELRERSKADIIDKLQAGFGEIEETSIPQALALNVKGSTEHKSQLDLTTNEIKGVWDPTVEGFRLAVDFVKDELGVARKDFLPYDAVLPVLAHYFFLSSSHSIVSDEHRRQLGYWFWRAAFAERYSGASQTRMNEDARWLKLLMDEDAPYSHLSITDEDRLISTSMTWSTSAIRNGILCLLNKVGPLDFKNRTSINLQTDHFSKFTLAEKHHIFPVSFLKSRGFEQKLVHSIPNFCFIPKQLNGWIADKPPSVYMREIRNSYSSHQEFESVMNTHLIPVDSDSGIWTDNYELFLKQRARLLIAEMKIRCGITTRIQPDERDPIVNKIEIALRDHIHATMLAHGPNYWKQYVTSDVQNRVDTAIDRHIGKTPGTNKRDFADPRMKLNHCDISDYAKIITNKPNWTLFASDFKNEDETRRVLDDFREYRTPLKHSREINSVVEHRAHAAFLWLRNALNLDLSESGI